MKIKRLVIENFKSIERIELIEPNPFTVFVGPNGSGKSNIFEALEFVYIDDRIGDAYSLFGGLESFLRRQSISKRLYIEYKFEHSTSKTGGVYQQVKGGATITKSNFRSPQIDKVSYNQFYYNFSRIAIEKKNLLKLPLSDSQRLALDASNLEKVLKRVLRQGALRDEIFEWLEIFVPSFKTVEVDDRNELHWFEESSPEYFTKDLISDGTYNILALLTAVYQSEEPQFLCIEEPENGLNPKVVKELVNLCRYACEEFGHYIWLNTHSQTLVAQLTPNEIILVDKKNGATETKQIQGMNLYDLPMDEAWLSNALGGGIPW